MTHSIITENGSYEIHSKYVKTRGECEAKPGCGFVGTPKMLL